MPSSMFGSGDEDSSSGEGSDVEDASALGIWGPAVPSSTVPTTGALSASHPSIAASASGTQLNSGNYFHFGTNKAGMAGVDRERVNAIIHEASRGSKYYEKAQRNDAKLQERAEALRTRSEHLSDEELQFANVHVERRLAELEAQRDLSRVWAVVDFDAFFAAVEERDFPELKGKPVAIGPLLISTTNYEARKYGVRSAMPEFIGKKLCPQLLVRPLRFDAYQKVAEQARQVYAKFDANFSSFSLDEAYLDLTEHLEGQNLCTEQGRAHVARVVQSLRQALFDVTKLTVSAGVACTPMLAKIAADVNKPDGQHVVNATRAEVLAFVQALNVRRVPGIGKVMEETLKRAFGCCTVMDLYEQRLRLNRVLSALEADFLLRVCVGVTASDSCHAAFAETSAGRKSISTERTFRVLNGEQAVMDKLWEICSKLAEDVRGKDLWGRTLTLKVKDSRFETKSRAVSRSSLVGGPNLAAQTLFNLVRPLMVAELPWALDARLIGVRLSGLEDPAAAGRDGGADTAAQPSLTDMLKDLAAQPVCPVCSNHVPSGANDAVFNAHLDLCLNKGMLKEMTEQPKPPPPRLGEAREKRAAGASDKPSLPGIERFFKAAKQQ